jgi:hypothetical protein
VDRVTDGTSALLSRWAPETIQSDEANRRRDPTLKSPERAAKIAAAKRGKPRPPGVNEALRKVNVGKKASRATRRKMSEAHKRRGTRPPLAGEPWTAEEDALLGTMKDRDVAARIGRSESAVSERRYALDVAAFTERAPPGKPIWTPAKDRLLGTMSDVDLARRLHCSPMAVFHRRRKLGNPRYRFPSP